MIYTGVVGEEISVKDKDNFYNEDNSIKYIYVSDDAASKTVAEDGSTVVTVTYREAEKYNYTVNNDINYNSVSGTAFEGDNATVEFPRYTLKDGVLYEANAISQQYKLTFAVNENNTVKTINYKKTSIDNVAYYSEAEDISTLTSTNAGYIPIRCSNGQGAYAATDAVITKLPAGTYKLTTAVFGNEGTDFKFYAGEKNIFTISTEGRLKEETSTSSFTLTEPTDIILKQAGNAGRSPKVLDYIIIRQEAETVSVSAAGYATYATKHNVEVPEDENVKVMTVKVNAAGTAIERNEVKAGTVIPAKTGILVKAAQGDYNFVVTSEEGTPLENNNLVAATTDVPSDGAKYFALTTLNDGKVGFAKVAKDVVIPAGKAYLMVENGESAKFFGLDGEATGINSVKTAKTDGAYYTLEGVKTTKPVKGLYIHNGKKIVVK